jgi:hypothetical protein
MRPETMALPPPHGACESESGSFFSSLVKILVEAVRSIIMHERPDCPPQSESKRDTVNDDRHEDPPLALASSMHDPSRGDTYLPSYPGDSMSAVKGPWNTTMQ